MKKFTQVPDHVIREISHALSSQVFPLTVVEIEVHSQNVVLGYGIPQTGEKIYSHYALSPGHALDVARRLKEKAAQCLEIDVDQVDDLQNDQETE